MSGIGGLLEPGALVRHPDRPYWGTGQGHSNIGGKVTFIFRHAGTQVIETSRVEHESVIEP